MTDLRRETAALEHALEQERRSREAAVAALQKKSELLAAVSHELRTPMGAIISMADLLLMTALDETQRRYADTLQQSARNLLILLNDVIDHEQMDGGHFTLLPRPVAVEPFLDSLETSLRARTSTAGLECVLLRDASLPDHVEADPVRLRQIIDNLIDNAVKFTREGKVEVSVAYEPEGAGSGSLHLTVCDTGIGIAADDIGDLFTPYARPNEPVRENGKGTGLGLPIVARLVELMDGQIACDSAPGRGTAFHLSIPCGQQEESEAAPTRNNTSLDFPPLTKQPHVLVVEDNRVNQTLIGTLLEVFGCSFQIAGDGREALAMLDPENGDAEPFDLVLMDIRMPGMDGHETARQIRSLEGTAAQLPIVALTAESLNSNGGSVPDGAFDGFVAKPIEPRSLILAITGALPHLAAGQPAAGSQAS